MEFTWIKVKISYLQMYACIRNTGKFWEKNRHKNSNKIVNMVFVYIWTGICEPLGANTCAEYNSKFRNGLNCSSQTKDCPALHEKGKLCEVIHQSDAYDCLIVE